MSVEDKLAKYASYLNLSESQRKKRIKNAEQKQSDRKKNPQGDHVFPEMNFIKLIVKDQNKKYLDLMTFRYKPKNQPIAVMVMFHGLNSHIGQGAHIAYQLAQQGIVTVGFDHRGFGRSQGQPGYVHSLETHLTDCRKFVQLIKHQYKHLPFFCMGLSMGGMATYYTTLQHSQMFQGAIMMAPALKNNVSEFIVGLTEGLHKILPDKMRLTKPVYGLASRNPQITDFVKKDPYAYKERASLSTAYMLVQTMDKSPQTFHRYTLPFMIVQGGLDKLVNPMVAFQLFRNSKTPVQDKQIIFYQGMWHDIWHEPQIFQIIEQMITWILKRVQIFKDRQAKKQIKKITGQIFLDSFVMQQ